MQLSCWSGASIRWSSAVLLAPSGRGGFAGDLLALLFRESTGLPAKGYGHE
jgi:hypothetical protein